MKPNFELIKHTFNMTQPNSNHTLISEKGLEGHLIVTGCKFPDHRKVRFLTTDTDKTQVGWHTQFDFPKDK